MQVQGTLDDHNAQVMDWAGEKKEGGGNGKLWKPFLSEVREA